MTTVSVLLQLPATHENKGETMETNHKGKNFWDHTDTGFIEFVCIHTETGIELENLLEKYRHQQKIRHKSVKLLFTGLPRAGKTVLKKRLLRVIKNLISSGVVTPSEGFEKPISIVMGSDIDWLHQHDLLDEAQTVLELIDQQSITPLHPQNFHPSRFHLHIIQ